MSRTDKDRPYWVRAQDPLEYGRVPYHYCGGRVYWWTKEPLPTDCSLVYSSALSEEEWNRANCQYGLPFDYASSPSWWTHQTAIEPQRRRERDTLVKAAQWYRADPEGFMEEFDFGVPEYRVPYFW